jgi:hypothetical protein
MSSVAASLDWFFDNTATRPRRAIRRDAPTGSHMTLSPTRRARTPNLAPQGLASVGLVGLIATAGFPVASARAEPPVPHHACTYGHCADIYDCPRSWSETNMSGTYLLHGYRFTCSSVLPRYASDPGGVVSTPVVIGSRAGEATISYAIATTMPVTCPTMVGLYTGDPPLPLPPKPTIGGVSIADAPDGYSISYDCSY